MSLWSVLTRRAVGGLFGLHGSREGSAEINAEYARLSDAAFAGDHGTVSDAFDKLEPDFMRDVARNVLRARVDEAVEVLRGCEPCRELLSSGGYDPIELLEELRKNIGRARAQMDIDESGQGGSQRGQGYNTRIRFGPRNFLLGTSLEGMTIHESQLQVILHELGHAAGDVIPPDGGNPEESMRNQHRITSACLPDTYERINGALEETPPPSSPAYKNETTNV